MSQTLYEQFSTAFMALPEDDMLGALDVAESFINGACHSCSADTVLSLVEMGRPADRLLAVFGGRTVGEVVAVMTRLRGELADGLARRGAPAHEVREIRDGGPRVNGHGDS